MSTLTAPDTGTDRVHLPGCDKDCGRDGCMVADVTGRVPQINTHPALEVTAFSFREAGERPSGYVELFPTGDLLVEGFFVSPADARRLAAMLLDAADKVEQCVGGAR